MTAQRAVPQEKDFDCANNRFKGRFRSIFWSAIIAATVGHFGAFAFWPELTAEDFSYFLRERPGAFILLGAGNAARGITAPHHSPAFDIEESVLPLGVELFVRLALESPSAA